MGRLLKVFFLFNLHPINGDKRKEENFRIRNDFRNLYQVHSKGRCFFYTSNVYSDSSKTAMMENSKKAHHRCLTDKYASVHYQTKNAQSFLRIWSHILKNSLMENFIFCAVKLLTSNSRRFVNIHPAYLIHLYI